MDKIAASLLAPHLNKDNKKAVLYIWNGAMVFFGSATDASIHRHHAILIAVGIDQVFNLRYGDSWHQHRLAVVDADEVEITDYH